MRGDIRLIGGIPPVPPPTRENPEESTTKEVVDNVVSVFSQQGKV